MGSPARKGSGDDSRSGPRCYGLHRDGDVAGPCGGALPGLSPLCPRCLQRRGSRGASPSWRLGVPLEGQFGVVHRAMDTTAGIMFAVRLFELHRGDAQQRRHVAAFEREIDRWRELRHPNIVAIQGYTHLPHRFYIHLELTPHGSIERAVEEFGALEGTLLRRAVRGTLQGLEYLHSRGPPVPHGNLRGATILVDDGFEVKLTGFGCSGLDAQVAPLERLGSLLWAAPEAVQNRVCDQLKADIWSLGCALLEIATGARPWGNDSTLDAVALTLQGLGPPGAANVPPIPAGLPAEVKDMVQRCLRQAPAERASARGLLAHELLEGDDY